MNYPFLLKFSKITNLTEARIASGYFADFISFDCSPDSEYYVEPSKINEIMHWVVGPNLALNFTQQPLNWILDYIEKFKPKFIELPIERLREDLSLINAEIIWKINEFDETLINLCKYFESEKLEVCKKFYDFNSICFFANINNFKVENLSISGLTLFGEKETEIGKSEKEGWNDVLESY